MTTIQNVISSQIELDYATAKIPFNAAAKSEVELLTQQVFKSFGPVQKVIDANAGNPLLPQGNALALAHYSHYKNCKTTQLFFKVLVDLSVQLHKNANQNVHAFFVDLDGKAHWCAPDDPKAKIRIDAQSVYTAKEDTQLNLWEARFLNNFKMGAPLAATLSDSGGWHISKRLIDKAREIVKNEYDKMLKNKMPEIVFSGTTIEQKYILQPVNRIQLNGMHYIASPYPVKSAEFWQMILAQKPSMIVKLASKEGGIYWPQNVDEVVEFPDAGCRVKCEKIEKSGDFMVARTFKVMSKSSTFTIKQLDFVAWPDFDTPSKANFIALLSAVEKERGDSSAPLFVHCGAGIGRTGTFIAAHNAMLLLKSGSDVNFYNLIMEMRAQRARTMVETSSQYLYLSELFAEANFEAKALPNAATTTASTTSQPNKGDGATNSGVK